MTELKPIKIHDSDSGSDEEDEPAPRSDKKKQKLEEVPKAKKECLLNAAEIAEVRLLLLKHQMVAFPVEALDTHADDIRRSLRENGCVAITGVLTDEQREKLKKTTLCAFNRMFPDAECKYFQDIPAMGKKLLGKWGGKSTGMFNKQPPSQGVPPQTFKYGSGMEKAQYNPFSELNVKDALETGLMEPILAVGDDRQRYLEDDSRKVGSSINQMTVPHIDEYNEPEQRRHQIIYNPQEGTVKLFYLGGGTHHRVQELFRRIEADLYDMKTGLKKIKAEQTLQLYKEFAVAPPPNSLVFWMSGVIHGEATATATKLPSGLYAIQQGARVPKEHMSHRLYLGTHRVTDEASREMLKFMLPLRVAGFTPSAYTKTQGTLVTKHKKNNRSTQFKVCHLDPVRESEYQTQLEAALAEKQQPKLTPAALHAMGQMQNLKDLDAELPRLRRWLSAEERARWDQI
jgi:hypothetical protein